MGPQGTVSNLIQAQIVQQRSKGPMYSLCYRPTSENMESLKDEIEKLPTNIDAGNVKMAYNQFTPIHVLMDHYIPYIRKAIREIESYTSGLAIGLMANTIDPGQDSPVHTDPNPNNAMRFHLAVQTSEDNAAYWWDERNGTQHFPQGWWCGPVPFTMNHRVGNQWNKPRIHLIVDLAMLYHGNTVCQP